MLTVGGLGSYFDAARAIGNGPQAIVNWVAGPSVTEGIQTLGADIPPIYKDQDFKPLLKHMVSRTPMIGQYLKNTWADQW